MKNKKAIAQLFRQHYPAMLRLARTLLHDDTDSEDVVDEVFATLLDKDILPAGNTARTFLLTAVRNRALNVMRQRTLQQRIMHLYMLDQQLQACSTDDEERLHRIRQIVDNDLDDSDRHVLRQRFVQQMTYDDIAQAEGISKVAVYKRLRKALDALQEKLSKND